MKYLQKGFTLIELLIVIAVLGVLAVAVLSAINPIEQINRGKDTGSRSDSEQFIGAIDRYYTSAGYYPWQTGATDTAHEPIAWTAISPTWADNGATLVLGKLTSAGTGELKAGFTTRIANPTYNTLYIYNRGTAGDSYYVCFEGKSGSFKAEANRRCSATQSELGDAAGGGLPPDLVGAATQVCPPLAPFSCLP